LNDPWRGGRADRIVGEVRFLLGLVLCSCAAADPGLRVADPAHAPTAPEIDRADLTFRARDGLMLYAQSWRPHGEPRGVLVIHHGLADHSDRYAPFAEKLAKAGYAVWAFDMRGHGRSAGPRVVIDRIDDMLDDLDAFVALVREREPNRPIVIWGHSLGGLAVALDAIERQPAVAGIVLAAPGIAFDAPALQAAAVRFVAPIAPNAKLLDTPHDKFSKLPDVVAEMDRDPLIHQPPGPARTARAAIDGVARVWAHPERLVVPLLVVHGTADQVTAPSGSRDLVARAGGGDRTLRLYDGLYHDVFHNPGGDRVADDVKAWLDAHTGGPAVAFPAPPAGKLAGDRPPRVLAVELDARGEHSDADDGATAGLRLRFAAGSTLAYTGGLDLRGGYFHRGLYEADAHVLGLAVRGGAAIASLTAGIGAGGVRGAGATHVPVELAVEAPLGPTRVLVRGGLGWRLGGTKYAGDAGIADEATALAGIRFGRDLHYWNAVRAGSGPFLALTYRNLGGTDVFGIAIGGELWGGN